MMHAGTPRAALSSAAAWFCALAFLVCAVLLLAGAGQYCWGLFAKRDVGITAQSLVDDKTTDAQRGVVFRLPKELAQELPMPFAGVVLEQGKPLPRPVGTRREVDEKGKGRYCIKKRAVSFSSSDGSDPRTSGMEYRVVVPVHVSPKFWVWSVGGLLAASAGLALNAAGRKLVRRIFFAEPCAEAWIERAFPWLLLALLCLKLWSVADQEVVASNSDPFGYVSQAIQPGSPPIWSPGIGILFGSWLLRLGIPFRLGIEFLWFGGCAILGGAIRRTTGSSLTALCICAGSVFSPWTYPFFSTYFSEPFVAACILGATGWLLAVLAGPERSWKTPGLWLGGLALGAWGASRIESLLVFAYWAAFAVLYGVRFARKRRDTSAEPIWRRGLQAAVSIARAALPAFVTLAVCVSLLLAIRAYNRAAHGVWMMCDLDSPGYTAVLKKLYEIDSGDSIRLAPVTRKALELAVNASPTLAGYRSVILDPESQIARWGSAETGVHGEPGTFIYWLIREILGSNPSESNAIRRQIAGELEAAFRDGRLQRRPVFYPLHPRTDLWLPYYPAGLLHGLRFVFDPGGWNICEFLDFSFPGNLSPSVQNAFDFGAMRRSVLCGRYPMIVEGRIRGRGGRSLSLAVEHRGVVLDSALTAPGLIDGPPASAIDQVRGGDDWAFGLRVDVPEEPEDQTELVVFADGIRAGSARLDALAQRGEINLGSGLTLAILNTENFRLDQFHLPRAMFRTWLTENWGLHRALLLAVCFLAGLFGHCRAPGRRSAALQFVAWIALGLAGPRVLYYATLDANLGWLTGRYYVAVVACVLAASLAASWWVGANIGSACRALLARTARAD